MRLHYGQALVRTGAPHMTSRMFLAMSMLVLPAVTSAQRGGRASRDREAPKATPAGARLATVRDIEDLNPAALLVDKRKKLALPDSAAEQLKALAKAVKERNKATLALYDSVRKRLTSTADPAGSDMQQSVMALRNLVVQLRDQRRKDADDALLLVPDAAKPQAREMLKEQDDEFDRLTAPRNRDGPCRYPDSSLRSNTCCPRLRP